MKLITEWTQDTLEVLKEGTGDKQALFIEGIFAQSEVKNRNGRLYPKKVMESAVDRYITEYVNKKRAVGEMNHPPRLNVDFREATHLITEMKWCGNDVYGKAKVLNTPMGKILEGLLDSGVAVGVSTRGAGSLKESNGVNTVGSDFTLTAVDVVADPSAPDAFVNGIMEGVDWVMVDGKFMEQQVEQTKLFIQEASMKDLQEKKLLAFANFLSAIKK